MQHIQLIFAIFIGVFVTLTVSSSDCRFPGVVGCRFNSDVCQDDEVCVDDLLFGNCQKAEERQDNYGYALTAGQLDELGVEVRRLVDGGYEWRHLYTQCVVASLLLSYRCQRPYDRAVCDGGRSRQKVDDAEEGLSSSEEKIFKDEAVRLLENYFQDYYNDLMPVPSLRSSDDGDTLGIDGDSDDDGERELVRVHKYKKARKRLSPESAEDDDDLGDIDEADIDALLQLSSGELQALSDYLDEEEKGRASSRRRPTNDDVEYMAERKRDSSETGYGASDEDGGEDEAEGPLSYAEGSKDSLERIFDTTGNSGEDDVNSSEGYSVQQADDESDKTEENTADDIEVLKELLNGEREVSSVDKVQGQRLERIVVDMIDELESPPGGASEETNSDDVELLNEAAAVFDQSQGQAHDSDYVPETAEGMSEQLPSVGGEKMAEEVMVKKAQPPVMAPIVGEKVSVAPASADRYELLNTRYAYITLEPRPAGMEDAKRVMSVLGAQLNLDPQYIQVISVSGSDVTFSIVTPNPQRLNASHVASVASSLSDVIKNKTGFDVIEAGIGRDDVHEVKVTLVQANRKRQYFLITFVLCGIVALAVLVVLVVYVARRHAQSRQKLAQLAEAGDPTEASKNLQDLCRQRMLSKSSEKPEPLNAAIAAIQRTSASSTSDPTILSPSSRGSTSSWSEEPVTSSMDITTGHIVLSYMEDHLQNKNRLNREWEALSAYEAEPNDTSEALEPVNLNKNRYSDILPYDHSRVTLNRKANATSSDYINASFITDHDPRNPVYIVTQGPLHNTVADFWQMVWEQGSVVIVNLTKLTEGGKTVCQRYWPEEGSERYHSYEVHLVSEHIWCDDYLVRSFYLKNMTTGETRTVTQFNYVTWPDLGIPAAAKTLLDFRRKVNKSFRGRACPIIVHCSDGAGRTGTYCLIDLVLNRMNKGAKEIDMAASLEHIRDQRMALVRTKEQFEFALAAIAEEVHAILKALPQQ